MRAAILTISDKASRGEREDTSGPALRDMLTCEGWEVVHTAILPDEREKIQAELIHCADDLNIPLVLTTGGTGFSPRDITPEATLAVIERRTPGIPEAMRAESMKITPRGCLSREEAGIRGGTLIINLPGSRKASTENFAAVIGAVSHGVEMLQSSGSADCAQKSGVILAVNISTEKGTQKTSADIIDMKPEHGIIGDAHAGTGTDKLAFSVSKVSGKFRIKLHSNYRPGLSLKMF